MQKHDAHPQVTPLNFAIHPEELKDKGDDALYNVYSVIWEGAAATLESPPLININQITIVANQVAIVATGYQIEKEGWLKFKPSEISQLEEAVTSDYDQLKKLSSSRFEVNVVNFIKNNTFPPQPYRVSSLIKEMEAVGIGRPSTYASAVSKLLNSAGKAYVEIYETGELVLTKKAYRALTFLDNLSGQKIDAAYTKKIEDLLDGVSQGQAKASKVIESALESVFPNIFSGGSPTWIDGLIGNEPEQNVVIEGQSTKEKLDIVPIAFVDVEMHLASDHSLRTLKNWLDEQMVDLYGNVRLSSEFESEARVVKAVFMQKVLGFASDENYLLELKFNLLLKWIVGLSVKKAMWSTKFYTECANEKKTQNKVKLLKRKLNAEQNIQDILSKFGFGLPSKK